MKEAKYWESYGEGKVRCRLCPHQCAIGEGKEGICKNKLNQGGKLWAHHYGEAAAVALDPVEKKPLYHFHPGEMILSVGTQGCNLACEFCQNYHLVLGMGGMEPLSAGDLVASAKKHGSRGIAYTYNEPYMSFEYVLDAAKLAREAGLKNVLVTNGFYNPEPFEELLPFIDAMNIDLKSIRDEFYKKLCKARVEPVKATIARASKDCLVEVTNLLVTGENDSDADITNLVDWLAGVDPEIPLHFSAYRPMYKLRNPSTPMERLLRAYDIASAKMKYVYLGNVMLDKGQDTRCPTCGALLIRRRGYATSIEKLQGKLCGSCGAKLRVIGE